MVFIKEILPNPAGKDTVGEWIAVWNDGNEAISLSGWSIKDASSKTFRFSNQTISPNQELQLGYQLTHINLNNDGDALTLYDSQGEIVDELSYSGPVGEDETILGSVFSKNLVTEANAAAPSLNQLAFSGQAINNYQFSPLLIAFGLSLTFGIGAAILVKNLLEKQRWRK